MAAAGVNRPDILQRQGAYAPPPGTTDLPGLEVAGEIVAVGPETPRWRVGDKVTALVAGGGYAEFCVAPAPQCLPIPGNLTMVEAAALPETFFTVWTNVFERGHLQAGETFPGAWRIERHRHHRHPACQPLWRAFSRPRLCRKML